MPARREITTLAKVLNDEINVNRSAEEIAEELIQVLDDLRSDTHRVAIVANYAWTGEESTLAVLGPFSTRAPAAARAVGEGMAGTARGGHGKWMMVPAYATVRAAWDAVRPTPGEEQERRLNATLGHVFGEHPGLFRPWSHFGPVCCCGLRAGGYCRVHERLNPEQIL